MGVGSGEWKQTGHGREIKLGRNLEIASSSVWIGGREEGTSIGINNEKHARGLRE